MCIRAGSAALTGFQTGSGQTGCSQKGDLFLHFAIVCLNVRTCCHMPQDAVAVCNMLSCVSACCLIFPVKSRAARATLAALRLRVVLLYTPQTFTKQLFICY